MPAKTQWLSRLPEILKTLASLPCPVLDRSCIEQLFGVGRRRAILLLHSWGGFESGNALFIDRLELIRQLEQIRDGAAFEEERVRRNRLAQDLTLSHTLAPGRKIVISGAEEIRDLRLAGLSPAIHLRPGRLKIEFAGTEELLLHLYELSQAILNDYARFEELIRPSESTNA